MEKTRINFFSLCATLAIFFSVFVDFSILNIGAMDWGLQFSWFFSLFLVLLLVFYSLYNLKAKRYNNTFNRYIHIIFWSAIIITFINLGLHKMGFKTVLNFKRSVIHTVMLTFTYFVYIFINQYYINKINKLLNIYTVSFVFVFIWGMYQLVVIYLNLPYITFLHNNITYKATLDAVRWSRRMTSIFPEPSFFSTFLLFCMPIFYLNFIKEIVLLDGRFRRLLFIAALFCGLMTKSLVFFSGFAIQVFLFTSYKISISKNKSKYIAVFGIIIVLFGFVVGSRLVDMLSGDDFSAMIRFMEFFKGIEVFKTSPIIGHGFGAIRTTDLTSTTLANLGILGFIFILFYIIFLFVNIIRQSNLIVRAVYVANFSIIVSMLLGNPEIEFIYLWVQFAISSVIVESIEREEVPGEQY